MSYTLAEAAAALQQLSGPVLRDALAGAVQGVATEYLVQNVTRSPVGRPQAMRAGKGKARLALRQDRHPGKLRASWRLSLGAPAYARLPNASSYPLPGAGQAAAVFRGYQLGTPVFLSDDAKSDGAKRGYADVVALVGVHVDRLGRTIGSRQAPEGTVLPSQREVAKKAPTIITASVTRALRAMRSRR